MSSSGERTEQVASVHCSAGEAVARSRALLASSQPPMATFAAQLKDMFFGIVERVTGYGHAEDKDPSGVQEPTKLMTIEVFRIEEAIVQHSETRCRGGDPIVSGGSKPQVDASVLRYNEIKSRSVDPPVSGGSKPPINADGI